MKNCTLKNLLLIIFFILPFVCVGQVENNNQSAIDSLKQVVEESTVDSTVIKSLRTWANLIRVSYPDSAQVLNERVINLCDDIISNKEVKTSDLEYYKKSKANCLYNIGDINFDRSNFSLALEQTKEALGIFKEINDLSGQFRAESGIASYYVSTGSYPEALELYEKANKYYQGADKKNELAATLHGIGLVYDYQGNYAKAINYYIKSLKLHEETENQRGAAVALNNIASLYFEQEDFGKALEFHTKSLKIREQLGNKNYIGQSLNNIGLIHEFQEDYEKALEYYGQALEMNKAAKNLSGTSYSYTNFGIINHLQKNYTEAISYHFQSLEIRQQIGDRSGAASSMNDLATVYKDLNNCRQSINYSTSALEIAREIGNLELTEGILKSLYGCYKKLGQNGKALQMYEEHIVMKDSLENKANQREVIKQELTYSYEKEALADSLEFVKEQELIQSELKTKKQQSYFLISSLALALLFGGFIYNRFKVTEKQKNIIANQKALVETEREKSESLLLNILPADTAKELKERGSVEAKSYSEASILFTDFIGFSNIAEQLSPKELLAELNYCFSAFDQIIVDHRMEKIKTIGDAYMAACGVPVPNENHAIICVNAAFKLNQFMASYVAKRQAEGKPFFACRIGVNSGPLVAGVVGTQKFQYDLWGDSVNIASRMESKGESGKVNISETTYNLIKSHPEFKFQDRGVIQVKGDRELRMFFVSKEA